MAKKTIVKETYTFQQAELMTMCKSLIDTAVEKLSKEAANIAADLVLQRLVNVGSLDKKFLKLTKK